MESEIQMVELIKFEPVTRSVWAAFQREALERGTVCFIWNNFSFWQCLVKFRCLNLDSRITSIFASFCLSQWLWILRSQNWLMILKILYDHMLLLTICV